MTEHYQSKNSIPINKIAICSLIVAIGLNGIIPQSILVFIEAPIIVYLAFTELGYLVFPIVIFYYYQLGLFMGISVYRLFSLAFIVGCFAKNHFVVKRRVPSLMILSVFLLFELFVMLPKSIQITVFSFIDLFAIFLLTTSYLENEENMRSFFRVFVIVAFLAILTGLLDHNSVETAWASAGSIVSLSRFQATFEDPNYMGYFYNIGIFAIIIMKPFKKMTNVIILISFYIVILSTLSMTAIIGNILFWLVYLTLTKKVSVKVLVIIISVLCISTFIYNYGLKHFDAPVIGPLSFRINEKLSAFELKDWNTVTTNRTSLLDLHKQLFTNQSVINQLFGGNVVCTYMVDLPGTSSMAHNDYIDTLLNVGIVGGMVLLFSCLYQMFTNLKCYKETLEDRYIISVLHKVIWLYYLSTLTVFLDFRFMLGLLI